MKKLFLSLFVAGALTFGLQSCGSDEECTANSCPSGQECVNGECEDVQATCDACGTYDGDASGNVVIALTQTDTTFTDLPVTAVISANSTAGSYSMGVDISALLGSPAGTLVPTIDGTLAGNTITITNESYTYSGIATIIINGSVVFDSTFDNLTGSLTLAQDAVGTITFDGAKQ